MTEAERDTCDDPQGMLEFLRRTGRASDRKLRLFAVACCRRIGHLFVHADMAWGLEVAERFADGTATGEELRQANELAMWAGDDASYHSMQAAAAGWAAAAAAHRKGEAATRGVLYEVRRVYAEDRRKRGEEQLAQCLLLRDIFRDPV